MISNFGYPEEFPDLSGDIPGAREWLGARAPSRPRALFVDGRSSIMQCQGPMTMTSANAECRPHAGHPLGHEDHLAERDGSTQLRHADDSRFDVLLGKTGLGARHDRPACWSRVGVFQRTHGGRSLFFPSEMQLRARRVLENSNTQKNFLRIMAGAYYLVLSGGEARFSRTTRWPQMRGRDRIFIAKKNSAGGTASDGSISQALPQLPPCR